MAGASPSDLAKAMTSLRRRSMGFLNRIPVILVLAACGLGASEANAQQAQGLASVGPVNPGNGYPQYYQDRTGVALAPCLDNTTPGDFCEIAASGVPNPAAPIVFPTNFPDEFFYWFATTVFDLPATAGTLPTGVAARTATTTAAKTGSLTVKPTTVISPLASGPGPGGGGGGGNQVGRVTLVMALEWASGGPGTVPTGQQIVFARFRLRITRGLVPGATYTLTYPYGVKTFVAAADGTINFTDDQGCAGAPCDFSSLLSTSNVGPFLAWDATAPAAPPGFLGDPAVNHAITGSPFGTNFVRIEGPSIGGTGVNAIQTDLFAVMGKRFNGVIATPLTVDRTSFSRSVAVNSQVSLFAHSAGNATVMASGDGLPTTTLVGDPATGRFFAGLTLPVGAPLPGFVRYGAAAPGDEPTVLDSPLVDEVTVTTATFSIGSRVLTVNATSSDPVGAPTLTASGSPFEPIGTLTGGILAVPLAVPPFQITVTSSEGGSGTLRVQLVP